MFPKVKSAHLSVKIKCNCVVYGDSNDTVQSFGLPSRKKYVQEVGRITHSIVCIVDELSVIRPYARDFRCLVRLIIYK